MKAIKWLWDNLDTVVLVLAVILPHAMAILPTSWRSNRLKHVVAILDKLAGNYLSARNSKGTVAELLAGKEAKKK